MKKIIFLGLACMQVFLHASAQNTFPWPSSGNIGIGTASPGAPLHVYNGTILLEDNYGIRSNGSLGAFLIGRSSVGRISMGSGETGDWLAFYAGATERARITNTGNIGIGTTIPDSKLTVAGNIHSQEVRVTVTAGADFVFEDDYKLRSLPKTEAFIKRNKHLPEIAPAKEMVKEGINLGEMNVKLLQKIEELTLHLIELNKSIEQQRMEMINHISKHK